MTTRRGRGEGSLYWHEGRQRWIAEVTVGYDGRGQRRSRRALDVPRPRPSASSGRSSATTRTAWPSPPTAIPLARRSTSGLSLEFTAADRRTRQLRAHLPLHIVPKLGARKLRDLRADEVDRWLAELAPTLTTRSLRLAHGCLNRAISRAMARDKVKRNVVALAEPPRGRPGDGRSPSHWTQAAGAARRGRRHPARRLHRRVTAHRREDRGAAAAPLGARAPGPGRGPAYIEVWRSVRAGGDTKTKRSRRTLALPARCVRALVQHREAQDIERLGELDRARPGVRLTSRDRAGRAQRPPRVPRCAGHGRRPRPGRMDTARAAPFVRLAAVRQRHPDRGDLASGRAQQHNCHRAGLPPPDSAGDPGRSDRHGPALRRGLTTRLTTRQPPAPTCPQLRARFHAQNAGRADRI